MSDRVRLGTGRRRRRTHRAAMRDAARCEGLILEPVCTAKALAGLAAAVRDGDVRPGERTVSGHIGGLFGLFGHPLAAELAAGDPT
jgi:L-cysteate sulfo-lyase